LKVGVASLLLLGCDASAMQATPRNGGDVEVAMEHVNFRVERDIVLEVRRFRGRFQPSAAGGPVVLDNRDSFLVVADTAEIAITMSSLANLLNSYVFAYPGAPLKNLSVSVARNRPTMKGTMHKGIDLPFEIEGSLFAIPEGILRLHADKIKSAHIPFKGLLHLFGEDLSKLVNTNEARGVRIEGDDILIFPDRLTPPPHIKGRVTAVRIEGQKIVQVFGSDTPVNDLHPPVKARNYIYHRGGVLQFGKLTMNDSDLEIIDDDPRTPFDFFLADYNRQLVAGYSKNTPSHGLIVHMPDYARVEPKGR
jgi:hypothetical protein